jgi:hypothetical protein
LNRTIHRADEATPFEAALTLHETYSLAVTIALALAPLVLTAAALLTTALTWGEHRVVSRTPPIANSPPASLARKNSWTTTLGYRPNGGRKPKTKAPTTSAAGASSFDSLGVP